MATCRPLADLNALYSSDLVMPPDADPRREHELIAALHPTITDDGPR